MSDDSADTSSSVTPGTDLARRALAAARAEARRRGQAAKRQAKSARAGPASEPERGGARAEDRDPQPLGRTIERLVVDRGWSAPAAVGAVLGRWDELVGAEVAAHCQPQSFGDGVLTLVADSTAWATQVRLLTAELLRRLNVELGHGTVTKINVRGPGASKWSAGPWVAPGGRGPRDTYG